jgi:repressor of nif and glnA expression
MKRDQDLLWAILGVLEASERGFEDVDSIGNALANDRAGATVEAVRHHLLLLGDKGFTASLNHGYWRITDAGHDAHATNPAHITETFAKLGQ